MRELKATMDVAEFCTWQACFNLTHFGELRADRRNAELLAMTFNVNRGKNQAAKRSDDFMSYKPKHKSELSDEQVEAQIESFFSRFDKK